MGLALARAVIPDEMLSKVNLPALFEYRRGAQDVYSAWSDEIARLSLKLEELPPDRVDREVAKLIVTEAQPKLAAYRNEMANARDKLFGDLATKVTQWQLPTMSLAYVTGLSPTAAVAGFAAALAPAVPAVVDYFVKRRDINRKNAMAYLIGISENISN
jgi:hypothetical protein